MELPPLTPPLSDKPAFFSKRETRRRLSFSRKEGYEENLAF